MDELLVDFLTETVEHLDALGACWARSRPDVSAVGVIDDLSQRLRAIGGTRGLLDLPRLQRVARAGEGLIDRLRGQARPDSALVDLVTALLERLRTILAGAVRGRREPTGDDSELIARIERAAPAVAAPTERHAYLTVFALNETFALPIASARSGARIESLIRIPSAPPHLVGFAELGGARVAVVCLARRLEPTARPPERGMLAIVVASGGRTFALAVQDFGDVVEAGEADITATSTHTGSSRAGLSSRVLRFGSLSAPILDPELVFNPADAAGSDCFP